MMYSQEQENMVAMFFMLDKAASVLRDVFTKHMHDKYGANIILADMLMFDCVHDQLGRSCLDRDQKKLINYPGLPDRTLTVDNFDFHLLTKLLRNLFYDIHGNFPCTTCNHYVHDNSTSMKPPTNIVWTDQNECKYSKEWCIAEIRRQRNSLSHMREFKMTSDMLRRNQNLLTVLIYILGDGGVDLDSIRIQVTERKQNDGIFQRILSWWKKDSRSTKIKFTDELLGDGRDTKVWSGYWDTKPAAIKKIWIKPGTRPIILRELASLRKVKNDNVIQYYDWEEEDDFMLIAFELCDGTLQDLVHDKSRFQNLDLKPRKLLEDMMKGLQHLHTSNIVHRDIKPSNVLIVTINNVTTAKVSDMGLSKSIRPGEDEVSETSGAVGTQGWIAPEMLTGAKVKRAVDIFSAGCVMYYTLTGGCHPFDPPLLRQQLISQGDYNLLRLSKTVCDEVCAAELVEKMIQRNPTQRPTADVVLKHTLFWSCKKRARFFQDVSDRIEKEADSSQIVIDLESHCVNNTYVFNGGWFNYLCQTLQRELTNGKPQKGSSAQPNMVYSKTRSYDITKVKSLLRVIRNKKHHDASVQSALGTTDQSFVTYFLRAERFPRLLIHVHRAMQPLHGDDKLKQYY